jgi:hypothetical protein
MFITTARPRMTNKSSNSRYRKVTFVARFLGTGVTVSAMSVSPPLFHQAASKSLLSANTCRASCDEEFC